MEGIPITGRRQRVHWVTGKGHDGPGLADVEVVEAVEQWAGEAAALEQPYAPALPAVVVVLPLHQRTAARGLRVQRRDSCASSAPAAAARDPLTERVQRRVSLVGAGASRCSCCWPRRRTGRASPRRGAVVDPGVGIAATRRAAAVSTTADTTDDQRRSCTSGSRPGTVRVPNPSGGSRDGLSASGDSRTALRVTRVGPASHCLARIAGAADGPPSARRSGAHRRR